MVRPGSLTRKRRLSTLTRLILRTIASGRTMHELTITPQGHLLVRETSLEASGSEALETARSKRTERARRAGCSSPRPRRWTRRCRRPFEFARSIARLYLTNLCHAAIAEPGGAVPELPPPSADLERAVLQAPPMTGLEYLIRKSFRIGGATSIRSPGARSRGTPAGRKAICESATRSGDTSAA